MKKETPKTTKYVGFTKSQRSDQLYWFLNKLLLLSKNTISIDAYDESICFPVNLLKEEGSLFPLGRYAGSVGFRSTEEEYYSYCDEMLEHIKKDIPKLKNNGVDFNKENFSWIKDEGDLGYGYVFFVDIYYKKLFIEYIKYMNNQDTNLKIDDKNYPTSINKIEILEDKTELKAITMYINDNYDDPIELNRGPYLNLLYTLASEKEVSYDKGFFDYFNSNKSNPIYKKTGFNCSKILKKDSDYITPAITITIKTQKYITQTKSKT